MTAEVALRPELPPLPARMTALRVDHRGYPVPWFVTWIDGQPDFRVISVDRLVEAHRYHLCWICGDRLGAWKAFTIGPMCAVNRTSGEPPSHVDCADYAARACPFLTRPHMKRREGGKPADATMHSGGLTRNPGATLVWITKHYRAWESEGTLLFDVGEPIETRWYAEGRQATRDEVLASIDSGIPALRSMAEEEGPRALAELDRRYAAALPLLPETAP